jgi:probable HAF family extracellular repeat protein
VRKIPRPLRQTMGAVLLTAVILFVQFERAAGIREAKRRPIPFRILLTPIQGHPQRAPFYAVEDLGSIGGRLQSSAADINASGQVLCVAGTPSGSGTSPGPIPPRTFLWTRGRVEDLATDLLPTGINAQGWLVGNSGDRGPCRWVHGVVSPLLSDWESYGSRAEGINDAGQIVGGRVRIGGATRAFLWMDGTVEDLGTLGGGESVAYDLNAGGDVVGVSSTLDFPDYTKEPPFTEQRAFLWRQGRMLNLGTLGAAGARRGRSMTRGWWSASPERSAPLVSMPVAGRTESFRTWECSPAASRAERTMSTTPARSSATHGRTS